MDRRGVAVFKLAVLLHDPPWKPWGIARSGYRLRCSEDYTTCIARAFKDVAEGLARGGEPSSVLPGGLGGFVKALQADRDAWGCVRHGLEKAAAAAEKLAKEAQGPRSHVRQSVLLLRLLAAGLRGAGLGGYASVAEDAARIVEGGVEGLSARLERVDRLASALDRSYLVRVYGAEDGESTRVEASGQVYVNPFNPRLSMDVGAELDPRIVAGYISGLIVFTSYFLAGARCGGEEPLLLYSLVYSLLEPLWYLAAGPRYVPVADTRAPTHTVFDHAAAAAMVSNWLLEGDEPGGCLVLLDLKSVQQWIAESRRLRDVWASSWLASWLAWKAARPFVEEYGPDVLVQPPARLHPFYASRLLSRLGCSEADDPGKPCGALARLLGLAHGWPVDPTVPSLAKLALPAEACRNGAEGVMKRAAEAYRRAWERVLGRLRLYVEAVLGLAEKLGATDGAIAGVLVAAGREERGRLLKALEGLEPPLPMQLRIRRVEEAWRKAGKAAEKLRSSGLRDVGTDALRDMLFYQVLVDNRLWTEEEAPLAGFRAAGRRSGQGYYEYALSLYRAGRRAGKRLYYNCHVCGAGAAIVDGEELRELLRRAKGAGETGEHVEAVRRLSSNVHGERLCPYCLAKRMLRDMLREGLAEEAVGLGLPGGVYERLGRVSTGLYTSRLRRNAAYLAAVAGELASKYPAAATWLASIGFAAPNRFLEPLLGERGKELLMKALQRVKERQGEEDVPPEKALQTIEALVLEAVNDSSIAERLRKEAEKASGEAAKQLKELADRLEEKLGRLSGRRSYAVVLSDGDRMGSGVLAGRLGIGPGEYAGLVAKEAGLERSVAEELAGFYRSVVEGYEEYVEKTLGGTSRGDEEGRSVIVTPSYHQSVSRALAVQAMLDREAVEALGGFFLYSGGDDASAILPPVEPIRATARIVETREGRQRVMEAWYPALAAAAATRRLYWGLKPFTRLKSLEERVARMGAAVKASSALRSGFNAAAAGPGAVTAVTPALAAHGRSVAVYYAGVKEPFWSVFATAHSLLDEKDRVVFLSGSRCREKDALVVAGSSGAAVAPLSRPGDVEAAAAAAEAAAALLEREAWRVTEPIHDEEAGAGALYSRPTGLSSSLFSDARLYAREALEAALGGRGDIVLRLVEHLVSRNIVARGEAERRSIYTNTMHLVREAAERLGGAASLSAYRAGEDAVLRGFLADGYSFGAVCSTEECSCEVRGAGGWLASSSVFQVLNAARITRGAR